MQGLMHGLCDRAAALLEREAARLQGRYAEPTPPAASADEEQVRLLRCAGPIYPGASARATLRIANPTQAASDISLYASHFISDSGCEISSLGMSVTPRRFTLFPNAQGSFEIAIAVPEQALRGTYSGLVRAMGSASFRAVVTFEVC